MIISGGKRKPAKLDLNAGTRRQRRIHQACLILLSADATAPLRIPVGADVMRTDYVSRANDEPMMLVHSYEPLAITKGTVIEQPEEGPYMGAGLIDRFTAIGKRPTTVVERLRARMPGRRKPPSYSYDPARRSW